MSIPQDFFGERYDILNSPNLTGTPTAPTAAPETNTTQLANTSFVTAADNALYAGRKNYIINGDFKIWQRATSQTTEGYLSADRWQFMTYSSSFSAQVYNAAPYEFNFTTDNINKCMYISTTGSSNADSYTIMIQKIEDVASLAGKWATVSFWYYSTHDIAIEFLQTFGTSGSAWITGIGGQKIPSTNSTWQKFTTSILIPAINGKTLGANHSLQLFIWTSAGSTYNTRTGSLGNQSGNLFITEIQVEQGKLVTTFERRTYTDELMLCRRYYQYIPRVELLLRFQFPTSSVARINNVQFIPYMARTPTITCNVYYMNTITHDLTNESYTPWGNALASTNYTYVGEIKLDAEI